MGRDRETFVRIGSFLLPLAILLTFLFILLLSPVDTQRTLRSIATIDYGTLSVVLVLSLVNYVLRFWRWAILLGQRAAAVPVFRHLVIYIAGFALTTTPGKAGEAMRSYYLLPHGISTRESLAALYAERLFDLCVVSMLAFLLIMHSGVVARTLGLAGAAVTAVLLAVQHPAVARGLNRIAARFREWRAAVAIGATAAFLTEVRSMMSARIVMSGSVLGLLAWGAEGIGAYLVCRALGLEIDVWLAVGIYATAMLAGAFSFLPGGLGGTEVVMTSLLVYAGATVPVAIAATMIVRLATLWFAVALGLGAWFGLEAANGFGRAGPGGMPGRISRHAPTRRNLEG